MWRQPLVPRLSVQRSNCRSPPTFSEALTFSDGPAIGGAFHVGVEVNGRGQVEPGSKEQMDSSAGVWSDLIPLPGM